jgi:NDP-sugar pyrophosphorylase family protein
VSAAGEITGAIIAAGEGRRLREGGVVIPKPLVPVGGVPLLETVIRNFLDAGITSLVAIVNEDNAACRDWVNARFPRAGIHVIVRTTASSLESFRVVREAAGPGRLLVSTVDAWCAPAEFARFAGRAAARPREATVLGLTRFVADERPLWARVDPDGRIRAIGGEHGDAVTAGLYLVPDRVRRLVPTPGLARLRDFLDWLLGIGEPMFGELMGTVVDVDRPEDVALAEALLAGAGREGASR